MFRINPGITYTLNQDQPVLGAYADLVSAVKEADGAQ